MLTEIQRLHAELGLAVERASEAFAASVPHGRVPSRDELRVVLEHTGTVTTALGELLEAIDRALAAGGGDGVRAFLREVESGRGTGGGFHPGVPRRDSPVGRLPEFYGRLVSLANQLYERRLAAPWVWRETVQIWQDLVYFGGMTASGGLLSRLDRMADLRAVAGSARHPWEGEDLAEIRRAAARAAWLSSAPEQDLLAAERRAWCELMDGWIGHPEALDAGATIVARILAEAPPADDAVIERLRKVVELSSPGGEVRRAAQALLGACTG